MRNTLLPLLLLVSSASVSAQSDSLAAHYAATITEAGLRNDLDTLASDRYLGRKTAEKGQRMAAAYIEGRFMAMGIPPLPGAAERGMMDGYRQQFPVEMFRAGGLSIAGPDSIFHFLRDFLYINEELRVAPEHAEVTVTTAARLGGLEHRSPGPVVVLLDGRGEKTDGGGFGFTARMKAVEDALGRSRVKVVLIEDDPKLHALQAFPAWFTRQRMQLGKDENGKNALQVIVVGKAMADAIIEQGGVSPGKAIRQVAKRDLRLKSGLRFTLNGGNEPLHSTNVLGFIEGSDKKGEVVAVTAHYNHLGVKDGEVYNGADDDGSGTVAVLAMARAFAKAKADGHGPRRSLLFMTVSGEEEGLFGSEWYTDHPVFPLDSTVADLNTDMIGRVDTVHGDSSHYVYVIGSKRISTELGAIIEQQNAQWAHLDLDYTFDTDSDPNRFYYRSDHYNFAKHGVPIAFFFNGVHADYHGPYDEVGKIRFDLLRQRALLVFHTAWRLANMDHRPVVDHPVATPGQ